MIWLIGCKGMLGTEIARQLKENNIEFKGTDIDVDITSPEALDSFASSLSGLKYIINCSAYTAVDKAESESDFARLLNEKGPENIASVAKKYGAKMIHISTDYVFDGTGSTPRTEDMPIAPIGVYGVTKADGEKAVASTTDEYYILRTAWLYGCSAVNTSLFGIGERTGNTPLEAMVFEYAQLKGSLNGMDTTVITELAEYYEKEIGYSIPPRTPFVGKNFNVTRAGIHADGLLKNEEIYNIFDTEKFLNRPVLCAISNTSGLAGIAHWINTYFKLKGEKQVDKTSELVHSIKEWVDAEYAGGRVTVLTDEEILTCLNRVCEEKGIALPQG